MCWCQTKTQSIRKGVEIDVDKQINELQLKQIPDLIPLAKNLVCVCDRETPAGITAVSDLPIDSQGLPCGSAGKESACNARDLGSISGLGRSPGEGKGYPLQYSGLESSMNCIVHEILKNQT